MATQVVFKLTNIDTGKSRLFSSIEKAQAFGDKVIGDGRPWTHHVRNFNDESGEGWQKNSGNTYMSIVPLVVE